MPRNARPKPKLVREEVSVNHFGRLRVVCWMALSLATVPLTVKAETAKPPANIAYVDIDELLKDFGEYKQQNDGYKQFVLDRLKWRDQRVYLVEAEWKELDALQAKEKALDDKEKARLQELAGLSQTRDKELTDLRGIREPTPEQEKRRKDLAELLAGNRKKVEELSAQFDKEVREREQQLLGELKQKIDKAVAEVAAEKGFVLVLEKALLRYAVPALDITPAVLQRLNKPAAG
ncbi:MAG: hypothetical protein AUJ96_01790 [Armatimonadetes bacterium CG2_30_66_41]|nr:OmpH family outer membrane protein [Armatimonadota bacterium]NCP28911.1 OmpH family outer membrane protein [Armatimonadota bacterium]NDK11859.1 OmpH family outer membrane protein [Armatimonadota bacterium]OIP11769.1 MAG: hypothetical protein AUJ96_01790 [Armatimonadetes bacterium CG2_30_66_41]